MATKTVQFFHCLIEPVVFDDVAETLASKCGLHRLLKRTEEEIGSTLTKAGVQIADFLPLARRRDILINKEEDSAVILTCRPVASSAHCLSIAMVGESQKTLDSILGAVRALPKQIKSLQEGTFRESRILDRIKGRQLQHSSNGKLLQKKECFGIFEKIMKLGSVDFLKRWVTSVALLPVPQRMIETQLLKSDEDRVAFSQLVADPLLVQKKYLVGCEKCGYAQDGLFFEKASHVADVRQTTSFSCPMCQSNNSAAIEVLALDELVQKAVGQGLWLEHLASAIVRKVTPHCWAGIMNGTDELDVVGVICGKVVLIECKDTSFGQNDLYSLVMKADNLAAEVILIVTTQQVHDNVKSAINTIQSRREIQVFSGSPNHIEEELLIFLNGIKQAALKQMLRDAERALIFGRDAESEI